MDLDELIKLKENEIINEDFNFENSFQECENLKYKNSIFFKTIYNEINNNECYNKTEQQIFEESKSAFRDIFTKIINQNETKEPFFEIMFNKEIVRVVVTNEENLEEEIRYIEKEFEDLGKEEYIKNNLLNDLINFSKKDKIEKLINGILYFIKTSEIIINNIQKTEFTEKLNKFSEKLSSKQVTAEEIKEANELLKILNYNIENETPLTKFYELFLGKNDSIDFIKTIKKTNLDIRNLNEFIEENENSQLKMTDIDNLQDVYTFFNKLIEEKQINTDEDLHKIFKQSFESNKNI